MSAAPRSDAAAAAPAPGATQAARRPGLRGHHKLYLVAVALVAGCVWLIVWLVVFGKVLPDDIVGFAAVVFQVTVKTGIMALLFARYVAGAGAVVAPADPEGQVGEAPGLLHPALRGLCLREVLLHHPAEHPALPLAALRRPALALLHQAAVCTAEPGIKTNKTNKT